MANYDGQGVGRGCWLGGFSKELLPFSECISSCLLHVKHLSMSLALISQFKSTKLQMPSVLGFFFSFPFRFLKARVILS